MADDNKKNDLDLALANYDRFVPVYQGITREHYKDSPEDQKILDKLFTADPMNRNIKGETYKAAVRGVREGKYDAGVQGDPLKQLHAVTGAMEGLDIKSPEYQKLRNTQLYLNNLVGDFKDSRDQFKKTIMGISSVVAPFAIGTALGAPAAAASDAAFVGPPSPTFTDKLSALYNSGTAKVAGGLSTLKNAVSPGSEFVGPPTASQSFLGKVGDKLLSPTGLLLGLSAAGTIADGVVSDEKKSSGEGGGSYGYGSDYVKTEKSPYRSIFDKERSPMMTDKYERFFRLKDRYAEGGTVEDPYKNYGAGPEKLFFENLDKPITGAGQVDKAATLTNPNQAAKRNAGYTGGFDDVNEFNTWARNNPDSYLKYFDYRRQDDPSFTRLGQVDFGDQAGVQDFGPDLNKALGNLIGYNGDVGGGQMTAYLRDNPQHRDVYSRYRKIFEPNYSEAFADGGDVNGPGGGKDDQIPAYLSDGEHVITAQEVSALGDGSTEAGHKRLYEMRKRIREHASKNKGGHSPKAKSIANYLKGL